ncbi:MAG TPA: iron uptake transporter deferrochelatase/peroxidase subunit [Nocardioides sp.]|uniref:iron uptake transporter deferrochelatase/peroxidase subunit n=1 Tax=Nocardioides sp. TaxID=35761 RepID=UPI002E35CB17|nr:iron uptake transporter deferrochelatase/peroxidase subunit [Nocardioides sp.]HEX5087065.1 iron uptake transporter deferrochelatase/peroxidase subunit [Nocardioides sp.]
MAPQHGLSRRRLLGGAGAGVAAAGFGAGFGVGRLTDDSRSAAAPTVGLDAVDLGRSVDFYTGAHQAGIDTPQQRYCVFMTFDITASTTQELQVLMARWSAAIAQCMAGEPVGTVAPDRAGAVAGDTGEALDLGPSSLTVTVGLGPGVFDERFGLADRRPKLLADLPALPSDQLRPELTGGDLSVQACADDPQVAYHAVRDLARMGRGVVNTRWVVLGFGRASAGPGQSTPRNLMGFKDGTRNIKEPADLDEFVWVDGDVDWMNGGGTYQVARKIRMDIEIWDSDDVADQQRIFGRFKQDGAPLTGKDEFDTPDFSATDDTGKTVIDPTSHVALAAPENNNGVRIFRRGYNFTDGINEVGQLDAGLLFVAYMNDPDHFVRLQTRLGRSDALNEYIAHIGSGIFAVPPAPEKGGYLAQELFA